MENLGYSNYWGNTPDIVLICRKERSCGKFHDFKVETNKLNEETKISCSTCNYFYTVKKIREDKKTGEKDIRKF